jgi:hypothetical protein
VTHNFQLQQLPWGSPSPYHLSTNGNCYLGDDSIIIRIMMQLMPVIIAIQEADIRRITIQSQPEQIVLQDPILKNPSQK